MEKYNVINMRMTSTYVTIRIPEFRFHKSKEVAAIVTACSRIP